MVCCVHGGVWCGVCTVVCLLGTNRNLMRTKRTKKFCMISHVQQKIPTCFTSRRHDMLSFPRMFTTVVTACLFFRGFCHFTPQKSARVPAGKKLRAPHTCTMLALGPVWCFCGPCSRPYILHPQQRGRRHVDLHCDLSSAT